MSTLKDINSLVWIGLFRVAPVDGCDLLDDASGAYVNAVAIANNANDFRFRVAKGLKEMGLTAEQDEGTEPLFDRLATHEVDSGLQGLAREAALTGSVLFGTFHTFED